MISTCAWHSTWPDHWNDKTNMHTDNWTAQSSTSPPSTILTPQQPRLWPAYTGPHLWNSHKKAHTKTGHDRFQWWEKMLSTCYLLPTGPIIYRYTIIQQMFRNIMLKPASEPTLHCNFAALRPSPWKQIIWLSPITTSKNLSSLQPSKNLMTNLSPALSLPH